MPKTAVGLFENPDTMGDVVHSIETLGFPAREVRTLQEPATFDVPNSMSFPRLDYEVHLRHELERIGASTAQTQAYVKGLQRGGTLLFATGTDESVQAAADVMQRHGAVDVAEKNGPEPQLSGAISENFQPVGDSSIQAGRIREPGGAFFVW